MLLSKPMLFRFNRLTLLANIVSLQFTEMSEYQPSSSCRASESRFFPYIHCKFCRVRPTTKMSSATVKPSILFSSKISSLISITWLKHGKSVFYFFKNLKVNILFPGHHLHADSDGEWITNSCVVLLYVAVVSKPRTKVPSKYNFLKISSCVQFML